MLAQTTKRKRTKARRKRGAPTEPLQILPGQMYPRPEAARAAQVAEITIIRAEAAGHLKAYRVGRKVIYSGQHLLDWLEAGGKTSKGEEAL